jgi:two-component sensor histidine kinase
MISYVKQRDYLNVMGMKVVTDKFKIDNEIIRDDEVFSDSIWLLDEKFNRQRVICVIASSSIYLFTQKTRWFGGVEVKFLQKYDFRDVEKICLSAKHCTLFALVMHSGVDLLFEGLRRIDMVLYLKYRMKDLKQNIFTLTYLKSFQITRGRTVLQEINLNKSDQKLASYLQETLRNSHKYGFLKVKRVNWWGDKYKEKFFILTGIGLLYFNKLTDIEPRGFIPILGASIGKIIKDEKGLVGAAEQNTFMVSFGGLGVEERIASASRMDAEEWVEQIRNAQKKALTFESDGKEKVVKQEMAHR